MSGRANYQKARGSTEVVRDGPEHLRSYETERVLGKLDFTREQAKAIEQLTISLVDELVHGPITRATAILEE